MAFSVYEGAQHRVYTTTRDDVLAGVPPHALPAVSAALLPPATRRDNRLIALLANPAPGLPAEAPPTTEPYKAKLQLDAVGQPSVGIGRDRFGAFGSGGVAFQLSDTLGDHTLSVAVDFTTSISGETSYGPIGVLLVLLYYLIGAGVCVLIGAVFGRTWNERRKPPGSARSDSEPNATAAK